MLVRQSTYDALRGELRAWKHKYTELQTDLIVSLRKYNALIKEWNEMMDVINAKGGQKFLDQGTIGAQVFTQEDITRLLQLVHPDKHDGKKSAVEMTQKLLKLRETI